MHIDTRRPIPIDPLYLLNVKELSAILNLSVRKVWALRATGELPKAIEFGKAIRWRRSDIEAWLKKLTAPAAGK